MQVPLHIILLLSSLNVIRHFAKYNYIINTSASLNYLYGLDQPLLQMSAVQQNIYH
jgi:hypothetical protein